MLEQIEPLGALAREVVASAEVKPGGEIPGWRNTTGHTLRVPGGNFGYPCFWVRDAAMMLGADLIRADEIEGWVRLIAATQAGPDGIRLKHGLTVPPYSIPDHITLHGAACWYPGAMDGDDQGSGAFGFLPPADDAFYLIQMVREHMRLTGGPALFDAVVRTPWGEAPVSLVCRRAFDSVAADPKSGLVVCEEAEGKTRVDWGFCDTVRKAGACLMPSLLRWRAARDMAEMHTAAGRTDQAAEFTARADRIRASLPGTFYRPLGEENGRESGMLVSATGIGKKDDVWASAYGVWLGVLDARRSRAVANHLLALYRAGGTVVEGQARHLPPSGEYGGHWERCLAAPDTYQNGAYWGTPAGWYIAALATVNRGAADEVLAGLLSHVHANRPKGAPWECINPAKNHYQNPQYCATVALPYCALQRAYRTP